MGPPPGFAPGMPPFPPGLGPPGPNGMPPFPMGPNGVPVLPPGAAFPPGMGPPPAAALAGPTPGSTTPALPQYQTPIPPAPSPADAQLPPAATAMSDEKNVIPLPDVSTVLSNKVKDGTTLAWDDPNYTPVRLSSHRSASLLLTLVDFWLHRKNDGHNRRNMRLRMPRYPWSLIVRMQQRQHRQEQNLEGRNERERKTSCSLSV